MRFSSSSLKNLGFPLTIEFIFFIPYKMKYKSSHTILAIIFTINPIDCPELSKFNQIKLQIQSITKTAVGIPKKGTIIQ